MGGDGKGSNQRYSHPTDRPDQGHRHNRRNQNRYWQQSQQSSQSATQQQGAQQHLSRSPPAHAEQQQQQGSGGHRYNGRRGYGDQNRPRNSMSQEHRYMQSQPHFTQPHMPNAAETMVHFHKSFGVMQEIFDHRDFKTLLPDLKQCATDSAQPGEPISMRFVDLGCAPGGFSACLLQDELFGNNSVGFGVTLPPHMGGFSMGFASERHFVQFEDIMALETEHMACIDNSVHLAVADAQNLELFWKRTNPWTKYRGMRTRSQSLGIWALTVKQCKLSFAKLRHQGSFIFRFGWRGIEEDVHPSGEQVNPELLAKYQQEEEWYKALTHWLFSVLKSLFASLKPFKSEYVHQADVSFYMVCHQFDRKKYEVFDWEAKLSRTFDELADCSDEGELVSALSNAISDSAKEEIDSLLSLVARMRAIGINSRKVTNPQLFSAKWENSPEKDEGSKADGQKLKDSQEGSTQPAAEEPPVPAPSPGAKAEQQDAEESVDAAKAATRLVEVQSTTTAGDASQSETTAGDNDIGSLCGTSTGGGSSGSACPGGSATAKDSEASNASRQEGTNGREARNRHIDFERQRRYAERARQPPIAYTVINGQITAVEASVVAAWEREAIYHHSMQAHSYMEQHNMHQHPLAEATDASHASLPYDAIASASPLHHGGSAMSPEAWMPGGAQSPADFYANYAIVEGGDLEDSFRPTEHAFLNDQHRFHTGDDFQEQAEAYMAEDGYHYNDAFHEGWQGGGHAWLPAQGVPAAGDMSQVMHSMPWHSPVLEVPDVPPPPSEPPKLPAEAFVGADSDVGPPPAAAPDVVTSATATESTPPPEKTKSAPAQVSRTDATSKVLPLLLDGKFTGPQPSETPAAPRRHASAASVASTASAPAAAPAARSARDRRGPAPRRETSEKVIEREKREAYDSSDDDGKSKHKRRAGRLVRERRQGGRKTRNPSGVASGSGSISIQDRVKRTVKKLWRQLEGDFLEALRFGLVCAMAWMLLSILISVLKIFRGQPVS